jgi:hypothetical protein
LFARDEMEKYRRPFAQSGEDRLPTHVWPRQIPIAGEPADVAAICADYAAWLPTTTALKKLFVHGDAGTILIGEQREFCRTRPDQREVTVPGPALHRRGRRRRDRTSAAVRSDGLAGEIGARRALKKSGSVRRV